MGESTSSENGHTDVKAYFLAKMNKFDFIRVFFIDLNGIARGIMVPAEKAQKLVTEGCDIHIFNVAFTYNGTDTPIKNISSGNIVLNPILSTLTTWPNVSQETEMKICQVFCSASWMNGEPIEADPRAMAVRQLQRLNARGLHLLSGTEAEFQLFDIPSKTQSGELRPVHQSSNPFTTRYLHLYEKFFFEMNQYSQTQGFRFDAFHIEAGKGQLEMVFKPEWGIATADNVVRFKQLSHIAALKAEYQCSFMAKPTPGKTRNGFHFNHSIWRRGDDKKIHENVMLDINSPDKLSSFALHWLAGLLHHGHALTAICSPTVNCYRRLHTLRTPDFNDWGIATRYTSIRMKNRGTAQGTYIENRNPSSVSNPYLVMAAVVAAGLDGVDRKLELPPEGSKDLGALPKTLADALKALQKDTVLCKALGNEFVDWFVALKHKESEDLQGVDVSVNNPEDFKREREMYFDNA